MPHAAVPPRPGGLHFFKPAPRRGLPADWPVQRPDPGGQEVAAYPDPPRATGWLVTRFGLDRMLPAGLVAKLRPQPRRPVLYRVPAG